MGELLGAAYGRIGLAGEVNAVPVVAEAGVGDDFVDNRDAIGEIDAGDVFPGQLLGDECPGATSERRSAQAIEAIVCIFHTEGGEIFSTENRSIMTQLQRSSGGLDRGFQRRRAR